jgi:plastocyanin
MTTFRIQPLRRVTLWTTALCLVVLALMLAACGGDSGSSSAPAQSQPAASGSNSGSSASSSSSSSSTAAGTSVTVTITEQTGGHDIYSFSPATVTIKAGDTIKWVNNSDENHQLQSSVAGVFTTTSIVPKSGSNDNTFSMTFAKAGSYSITSMLVNRPKDGQHTPDPMDSKAMLMVTVN